MKNDTSDLFNLFYTKKIFQLKICIRSTNVRVFVNKSVWPWPLYNRCRFVFPECDNCDMINQVTHEIKKRSAMETHLLFKMYIAIRIYVSKVAKKTLKLIHVWNVFPRQ